jgi:signal transduction histidine kinase
VLTVARRVWTWNSTRPVSADLVLTAILLGLAVLSSHVTIEFLRWAQFPGFSAPSSVEELGGVLLWVGPLAARRRLPLVTAVACTLGYVVSYVWLRAQEPTVVAIALSVAIFSAAAYGRARWRHWVCGGCLVVIMGEYYRLQVQQTPLPHGVPDRLLYEAFPVLFYLVLACSMWALGSTIGAGRRRAAVLLERTIALEEQREQNARRAVFEERVRIARELHDVVAHHVSVMGVQAGAARRVMTRQPEQAQQALSSIESSSRQAVAELQHLLGFLRADQDDTLTPQPDLSRLPDLIAHAGSGPLTVDLQLVGERRQLSEVLELSAYRLIQEALTNAVKHSGGTTAHVRLTYSPQALDIAVCDNGTAGVSAGAHGGGGGHGLIGMRERVRLHGGQLRAGPRPEGGFAVHARLPLDRNPS